MITPSTRGSTYVVDIKLKERVPYQQKLEGDVLAIDFARPGGAAAGAPAPDAAPAAAAGPAASDAPAEDAPQILDDGPPR
jgi:hypothetical protein